MNVVPGVAHVSKETTLGMQWVKAWPEGSLPFQSLEWIKFKEQLSLVNDPESWDNWVQSVHAYLLGRHQSNVQWRKEEVLTQYRAQARLKKWLGPILFKYVWMQTPPPLADVQDSDRSYPQHHPKHPLPLPGWEEKLKSEWEQLRSKFGFADIIFPSCISSDIQFSWIREVESGLSQLCHVHQCDAHDLGGGKIGLSLGFDTLQGSEESGAFWHWLDRRIYIQNEEGWGSFAHEWCHAMDQHQHALKEEEKNQVHFEAGWLKELRSKQIMEKEALEHSPEHRWIQSHFESLKTQTERWHAYEEWLKEVPLAFERLVLEVEDADLRERFHRRLEGLKKWVFQVTEEGVDQAEKQAQAWGRWRLGNEVLCSRCDLSSWTDRWNRLSELVEKHWADQELSQSPWLVWASFKDEVRQTRYWSLPHECLARSFHAVTVDKIGHESWVADRASQVDWYPQGEFLKEEKENWVRHWGLWKSQWKEESAWLQAWNQWMMAPTNELFHLPTPWCPEGQEWPFSSPCESLTWRSEPLTQN